MAWINDNNRTQYIRMFAHHFNKTVAEVEKMLEKDPTLLDDFVDWLEDGGKVSAI